MDWPAVFDAESARVLQHAVEARLREAGVTGFRAPPPQPTTCCGRGCAGCVWESYYAALGWWREDAESAVADAVNPP